MGKLVWSVFCSVDGYYAGPNGEFIPPAWSDDMNARSEAIMKAASSFLYGRVNFEFNRAFWQQAETDPESDAAGHSYAAKMNAMPKTVFSRTLAGDPGWNAAVAGGEDMDGTIARLKAQNTRDIYLFGSGRLAQSLIERDLIDRYDILLIPHIQGDGLRIFDQGLPALPLSLLDAQPYDTGAVLLRYARNLEA